MYPEAYGRRTAGIGQNFQKIQRRRIDFPECRVVVEAGLLLTHRQNQHILGRVDQGGTPPPREAQTYRVSFPKTSIAAPVPGGGVPGRGLESD